MMIAKGFIKKYHVVMKFLLIQLPEILYQSSCTLILFNSYLTQLGDWVKNVPACDQSQ